MSSLVVFLLFVPLTSVFVAHALLNRLIAKSPQVLAILAILAGVIPFLFLLIVWPLPIEPNINFYVFFTLVYLGYGYSYFHFFNMSETSRRARMIGALFEGKIKNVNDLDRLFVDKDMVSVRLERLESLGQVKESDGIYFATGKVFPMAASTLYLIGRLLNRPWPAMKSFLENNQ